MALEGYKSNYNVVYSSKYHCVLCGRLSIGELCWSDPALDGANRRLDKWQTNIVPKSWLWKSCPTTYTCW